MAFCKFCSLDELNQGQDFDCKPITLNLGAIQGSPCATETSFPPYFSYTINLQCTIFKI